MEFSKALRLAIKRAGWSPTKVAAEIGVSESAVVRWLNGQREPRLQQFLELRRAVPGFAELIDSGRAVA